MASHNIVGSEATTAARLVAFSHVHGSIHMFPRRRRGGWLALAAFLAGLAVPLALALILAAKA